MKLFFVLFLISFVCLTRAQPIDGEGVKFLVGMIGDGEIIEKAKEIVGEDLVNDAADLAAPAVDFAFEIIEETRKIIGDEATGV